MLVHQLGHHFVALLQLPLQLLDLLLLGLPPGFALAPLENLRSLLEQLIQPSVETVGWRSASRQSSEIVTFSIKCRRSSPIFCSGV